MRNQTPLAPGVASDGIVYLLLNDFGPLAPDRRITSVLMLRRKDGFPVGS